MVFPRKTLRSRLFRFQLIGLCISVLAAVAVWHLYIDPAFRLSIGKGQAETAKRAAEGINDFIEGRIRELQMTAEIGAFWREGKDSQKEALHRLLKLAPEIEEVSVVDRDGQEQIRLSRQRFLTEDDLRVVKMLYIFRAAIEGRAAVGPVYYSPKAEPHLAIAVPMKSLSTGIIGVLKAEINLKTLWHAVSGLRVGHSGHLYVVDGKGDLIAHPNYSKVLLGLNMSKVSEVAEFLRERTVDPEPAKLDIGEDGKKVLTTFAGVSMTGWGVIVEEPVTTAFADMERVKLLATVVLFLAMTVVIVVSDRFSKRVSVPVRELEKGAELISGGKLDHRLTIRTGDELESLSDKFNRMGQALKESRDHLEQKITDRTKEISALYAALAPLQASDSLGRLLENVIERLIDATGGDAALIRLREKETGRLFCPAARGFTESYLKETASLSQESPAMFVLTTGIPVIAPDIATDPRFIGKSQISAGLRSCAVLPLMVSDEIRGIVHVASHTAGFFNSEKENHLMAIAHQMGVAIENHDLFTQTQLRQQRLQALYTVAETVTRSMDLGVLTQAALVTTIEVLNVTAGRLYVFDEQQGCLRLTAHHGIPLEYLDAMRFCAPGAGVIGKIFQQNEPMIVPNIENDAIVDAMARRGGGFGEQFLSAAGLPITIKDRVVGVIQVYGQTAGQFDSQDLELLSAIGRQIGAAVENARLFEETAQRAGQQEALNVVASTMSQSLDLDELFKIALDKLVEVTGRERATIRLKDAETGRVELFAHRGFTEEEVEDLRRKTPHRTSEQVFASGEAMVINESESDSYSESLLRHSRSVAWIPMKSRSDVIGVLGISATRPMAFSPRELDFLQAIANVVGVALDNVRAYQQTRRNLERIRALHEIDKAILSSLDVKTVLDVLLEQIEVFLPYPAVTMIRLFNRKTGVLEPAACRGVDETEWKKSGNITATSNPMFFKQRAPFVISDLRQEPGPLDPEFLAKNHLVSLLVVPLFAKGETLGALSFYTRERHHFSGQETEFLSTLAGQAAIAIYNSQLYGELREQALELERSNKVKSEFLGIMSHELTTPITAIMGYATLIDEEVTGKANPEQKRAAQVIRQKGDDLLLMIRGILEATKLESGGAVVEKKNVDVAGLLNELKGSFTVPPEKSVSLYWEYGADLPSIRTDGAKLKQILNNLIQNAIKFTSEGSVSVSARYEPEAQVMRLRVKDTGAGIPPEMLPTIFEKFRQVDSSDTRCYEGIGLGLFIAKKFAELLGGEILVESETGKGSSFCVTLPWRPDEAASRSTDSELPSYRQSMRLL